MKEKLKGKDVNLLIDGAVVARSTSCNFSVKANMTDSASKDDDDPEFEHSEVINVSWEAKNESFIATRQGLVKVMQAWLDGRLLDVSEKDGDTVVMTGKAFITNLSVSAPKEGNATLSLSLTGNGVLS